MTDLAPFDPKTLLATLTTRPGVYQMLDAKGHVLYVGKARNLKDRVASYFRANVLDPKTRALVQQVQEIVVTITHTENEALILENNLIKRLRPRYNILLRDDKTYPYLFLSGHPDFPRLCYHRGAQREKGDYFGPYPNASAVHETLDLLQKLFKIRQCSDPFFKSRNRPCLQYQIKRCTAPCVGYIDTVTYQENVTHARLFLQGKNSDVIQQLVERMENAAAELLFEEAARFRDQILSLRQIQQRQYVSSGSADVDVIAIASREAIICIEVVYIRGGRLLGNRAYFPKTPVQADEAEALSSFLSQYYLSTHRGKSLPKRILINKTLSERAWIQAALVEQWQQAVTIVYPSRGESVQWLRLALMNAQQALISHLASQQHFEVWLTALQKEFHLPSLPQRLECFDISHTGGEATVASCVVFGPEGPLKEDYRRFNIDNIVPGDDYAAMKQVLARYYTRRKEEGSPLPDVLLIDGGKGQLAKAEQVLEELQVTDVCLIGVAKGATRKPGLETLFRAGNPEPIRLSADSPVLHLIQRVRDEAHRFAITGHRQQRAKKRITSQLQEIPGIGTKRRRELLKNFGGMQGVLRASISDLVKVPGISAEIAERLYGSLHGD